MPSESTPFTPSSILFRPRARDQNSVVGHQNISSDNWLLTTDPLLVEAPGTAPGSDRFIATAIYRHSRLAPALLNIGMKTGGIKSRESSLFCRRKRSAIRKCFAIDMESLGIEGRFEVLALCFPRPSECATEKSAKGAKFPGTPRVRGE